ncbi:MAG: NADH-quinone oxidoreductase subunit N [Phycisphaerales bacterium]
MIDRVATLWPEIILFATASIVMLLGLSPSNDTRRATTWITGVGLFFAFVFSMRGPSLEVSLLPGLPDVVKPLTCLMGLLLLLGMGGIDARLEREIDEGRTFDPLDTTRGEFLAFFLLSLIGLMLCTTATDLIWLFLALELTSLPTYVMVATSRPRASAGEAGVKYFFLGALAAAIFLYGFALLYGATGSLKLDEIRAALLAQSAADQVNLIAIVGALLAIIGVSFKIAAVPMHFYTADVYEGAASPVSAFLAFVPKTAGFIAIMGLMAPFLGLNQMAGEPWPAALHGALWLIAALTMTIGNTLAIMQSSAKRMLAYSSVAHSGYMLIGVIAGPSVGLASTNGFAAVVFYLFAYGVMNTGAFFALACLERDGEEVESIDDLRGVARRQPGVAAALAVCALSLLGLPPLIGFFGKLYLFAAGIAAGEYVLVVIAGLNSAVAAYYYLRLAGAPWIGRESKRGSPVEACPFTGRGVAIAIAGVGVVVLSLFANLLVTAGHRATRFDEVEIVAESSAMDDLDDQARLDSDH